MWCLVLVLAMMAKSSAGSTRAPASARRSAPPARPSKAPARKGGGPGGGPPEQASAVASFYRAHRREIWGLVSLVVALICALGIYGGLGGLVGSAFRRAAGISVGWARLAVPLALAAAGVLLVSGRHAAAAQQERHPSVRIIGGCLVMAALAGILHLAAGRPTWGDGLADFEDAGGYLGFASGGALALLAGVAGAVVILLAVGLLGWLAVSGMSLSTVARGLWLVLRRVGLALAAVARLVVAGRQALSTEEVCAWAAENCRSAGIGCVDCKGPLIDSIVAEQAQFRERAAQFEDNPDLVRTIIVEGSEAARDVARETMEDVRAAVGISHR